MAAWIVCPHCRTRVILSTGDVCPSCRKAVTAADLEAGPAPLPAPAPPPPPRPPGFLDFAFLMFFGAAFAALGAWGALGLTESPEALSAREPGRMLFGALGAALAGTAGLWLSGILILRYRPSRSGLQVLAWSVAAGVLMALGRMLSLPAWIPYAVAGTWVMGWIWQALRNPRTPPDGAPASPGTS